MSNKKKTRLLYLASTQPTVLLYEPQPSALAPGSYVLLVIMTFLENKSMLLVLIVRCFCEYSCFEINSMTEKFNSVSPTLLSSVSFCYKPEPLMRTS